MPASAALASTGDDAHEPLASLPGADEALLWQRLREHGDADARAALIDRYRPFARTVAATYYGRRVEDDTPFDDYHQWALVAMIESVDRFDAARGVQFKTYASRRMHGGILNGIESSTEKQRQVAMQRRLREERVALELKAAQEATVRGGHSIDDVFAVLAEVGIGLAIGLMLEDSAMIAPAPDAVGPDHAYVHVEQRQLTQAIRRAVKSLSEQEQAVIHGHYVEDQMFSDIALQMGLTKGRISQVHRQALDKLRRMMSAGDGLDVAL